MTFAHRRNDQLIDGLRSEYVTLYAPTTAWGNMVAMMLGIPGLRGYWSMSSFDENGNAPDFSGQSRTLSGISDPAPGSSGLITYADFVASNDYFQRADEAGLDITGNLTMGCWVNFDAPSTDAAVGVMSKWGTNDQQSYRIYKNASNEIVFAITNDGTTDIDIDDSAANYAVDTWFLVVGKFVPSTSVRLFINGTWYTNTTGIPASIYSSTTAFEIGRYGGGNYLDGQVSQAFLCAYAVPDRVIEALYAHSKALFMSR